MSLSQAFRFILFIAVFSGGFANVAAANESSKQPPLEIPASLIDKEANKAPEKAKPEAVKKNMSKTEAVSARDVTSVEIPAAKPAAVPAKDLSGLPDMASYKTRSGDTLEKIIQKFYPASPLRTEVLRDAVIQNNPKAFPKGNAKSLVMGSTLSMPDQFHLSKKLLPVAPAAEMSTVTASNGVAPVAAAVVTPANPAGGGGAAAHSSGHNMALQDPKRGWVRYP